MVINRETAQLNKTFGNLCKVKDIAGREIAKAAYSYRGSTMDGMWIIFYHKAKKVKQRKVILLVV